eukprot:12653040-Heterocapsa_arctica.AAC.1
MASQPLGAEMPTGESAKATEPQWERERGGWAARRAGRGGGEREGGREGNEGGPRVPNRDGAM